MTKRDEQPTDKEGDEVPQDWKDIFDVYRRNGCTDAWLYRQIEAHSRRALRVEHPGSPCPHGNAHELDGRCNACDCGKPSNAACCRFAAAMIREQYPALADRVLELVVEVEARSTPSSAGVSIYPECNEPPCPAKFDCLQHGECGKPRSATERTKPPFKFADLCPDGQKCGTRSTTGCLEGTCQRGLDMEWP